jgi:ribose transport system substrate-binding protein
MAGVALGACRRGPDLAAARAEGAAVDTSTGAATRGPGDSTPASKRPFVIAMIGKSSNNVVFVAARHGAEQAAAERSKALGRPIQVVWMTPPEQDGQLQAQRIAEAVNEGVNAILVSCTDPGKVTGAINDAVDRGVPVMTFDSDAPASKRFAMYGPDDEDGGRQVMRELAGRLGGKGKVAILAGNQNALNLQARVRGAREEAARYPGITVVGAFYHVEAPQDAAAEVLRVQNATPDITGWAFIGGWPLFTPALLTAIDPSTLSVVSFDAMPASLAYIDQGVVPVLYAQPIYQWGYVGVNTIVDHVLLGKPVSEHVVMPLVRVSRENLGTWARQLKGWGFPDVDPKYLTMP